MMIQKTVASLLLIFFVWHSHAQISGLKKVFTPSRDLFLGKVIKSGLESYHFSKKKVNDSLSKDSFKLYVERLDYSKRYLLQSDVDALKKYETKIDDEMVSGNLRLMEEGAKLLKLRVQEAKDLTKKILAKPFNFSLKEEIELDPKKRSFAKNKTELKDVWRKTLKLEALNRFLDYRNRKEALIKEKKEKKGKKAKKTAKSKKTKKKNKDFEVTEKTTEKQMEIEARKEVAKSFDRIFKRRLRTDHNDELSRLFNSVTMAFDPHTSYLAPKAKEDFDIDISGSLEGIGAVLREDGDYIKVVEIVPGSASWKQGDLRPEDTILKVAEGEREFVDIVGMRLEDAVRKIRGKKGTTVRLNVRKSDGTVKVVPIVRDTVIIEEAYAKSAVIKSKKYGFNLGYIYLPKFYRDFSKGYFEPSAINCTDDVRKALEQLKAKNVDGVILDLRMNGGGSLEDSVQMSGLFIKQGPVVQVKNSQGKISVMRDSDPSIVYSGPLVVLVNKFSASASEILAGALQDYNRAIIIGASSTHGKGTVQSIIDLDQAVNASLGLPSLGSIKLTISKFYRITGSSTQFKGIIPDIVLPDPQDYVETGEKELEHALPWDEIRSVKHKKWGKGLKIKDLKKLSEKRIRESKKFAKLNQLNTILKSRRERTSVSLNAKNRIGESETYKKETEDLQKDENSNEFKVTYVPDGLTLKKIKKDKRYADDVKDKTKTFEEKLLKDIQLEEVVHIFNDLFKVRNIKFAHKNTIVEKKSLSPSGPRIEN